ncbi:MAG: ion transporter [Bacteroidales bacterium]|jgi:voltage-gated potassium channel|nr:ion transporter [Bacteroidales bacterium]
MTKKRIFEIIERAKSHDSVSAVVDNSIIILICLNSVSIILESFNDIAVKFSSLLLWLEYLSVFVFTIEYLLRIWTADYKYPESKQPYLKYLFSFLALLDLCAILPFYFSIFLKTNFGFTRVLRLFRLIRLLKLTRYNSSLVIIAKVLRSEKDKIFMTIFIIGLMILIASSIMYNIENVAQPEIFSNIPATMWWAVGTFTGNADVFPVTIPGKILSGIIGVLGIGLIALPSGIICSGFMKEIEGEKREKIICPYCGKEIHKLQ